MKLGWDMDRGWIWNMDIGWIWDMDTGWIWDMDMGWIWDMGVGQISCFGYWKGYGYRMGYGMGYGYGMATRWGCSGYRAMGAMGLGCCSVPKAPPGVTHGAPQPLLCPLFTWGGHPPTPLYHEINFNPKNKGCPPPPPHGNSAVCNGGRTEWVPRGGPQLWDVTPWWGCGGTPTSGTVPNFGL